MNDEIPKHRKRRRKKPYKILYRCKPSSSGQRLFGDNWSTSGRYATEDARNEALNALKVGGIGNAHGINCFEYKKG